MDFANKARQIERKLARTVDAAIGELVGRDEPAPLELLHAVLDRAEREVQDIGRGRRVFPFNVVRIQVLSPPADREGRARVEAVMAGPPSLAERLSERLRAAGCTPDSIATELVFVKRRAESWQDERFQVLFDRIAAAAPARVEAPPAAPRLKLTVLKGTAGQRVYAFTGGRIAIGRRADVLDQRQRLIRTNDVAFAEEGPDENRSVSRRHAHIAFADGGYRLVDDRSAHGTSVVRAGRTIKVPAGARGARLASGDEIVLGQARLKVTIEPALA